MEQQKPQWNDALLVGDPTIDEQHKDLIQMVASYPIEKDSNDNDLFEAILDYTGYHFEQEQGLMEQAGYPGLEEHKQTHKRLLTVLTYHRRKFLKGDMDGWSFRDFLNRWICDHIMECDQEFGAFLKRNTA